MSKFFKIILVVCVLAGLLCAFFYHLNFTALQSYDEAWYGDISRNLARTHNPLRLIYNGETYIDHPPLGFMLMAIPTVIWGSNEWSVRAASALLGVGCIGLLYLIGTRLSGRSVGIMAAAMMMSSLWFMLRARSGNLDVPFLFWSLFTFYWLTRARHHVRYFYPAVIGFAAMFLTKTLVGMSMLPVFIYVLWLERAALKKRQLLNFALLALVLILPWYVYNQAINPDFLTHHFIAIGFKSKSNAFTGAALTQALYYLRVGVGRWFKLMMIALPISLLVWFRQKSIRPSLQLVGLYVMGLLPFLFSRSVEVWHLVPLYAPLALLTAVVLHAGAALLPKYQKTVAGLITVGVLLLAVYQFRQSANLIYAASPQSSSERDIARQAARYPVVYLVETFYPAAVYYSGTHIVAMGTEPQAYQIVTAMLQTGKGPFIVHHSLVDQLTKDKTPFRILGRSVNYYLITY